MIVLDIVIYLVIAALLSWYFYFWRRKDLLGGYIGGVIVGLLGAILGGAPFTLGKAVKFILDWLQNLSNVNVVASILGGFIALFIFNKINHDRTRKDF